MTQYKTSSWYVDASGVAQTPSVKYHEDRFQAERQYHLYCAAAATSENPMHVSLLETIDGVQIKRECYRHEVVPTEEPAEEGEGEG